MARGSPSPKRPIRASPPRRSPSPSKSDKDGPTKRPASKSQKLVRQVAPLVAAQVQRAATRQVKEWIISFRESSSASESPAKAKK
ncbi:hypothetical protein EB796_007105 [Bugula neritina]|uniref:Uncharacterized protein n=1 Tax=Bugula neritina TaxID=10212 RepID=A0A7J7K7H6_BUGNE|nr:hypothetical protein EB796_007105 [Bugula neritina]